MRDVTSGPCHVAARTAPVPAVTDFGRYVISLGGLLAYYSIIHIPWDQRPQLFAEFHRVLAPGGVVMLVFQVGDELAQRTEYSGTPVALDFYRQQPEEVAALLRGAGFEVWMTAVRECAEWEKTQQGYLLVRKWRSVACAL